MTIAICILAFAVAVLISVVVLLNDKLNRVNKRLADLLNFDIYASQYSYARFRPYAEKRNPYDTMPTFIKSICEMVEEMNSLRHITYTRTRYDSSKAEEEDLPDGDD